MSKTCIALVTAAIGLAGACLFVWHQLQSSRAVSQAQLQRITELELDTSHPAPALPGSAPPPDEPSAAPQSVLSGTPLPVTKPVDTRRMMQDPAYYRRVMKDPEYRAAMIERRMLFTRDHLQDMRGWVAMSDQTFEDYIALEAEQVMELGDIQARTAEERASEELAGQSGQMRRRHERELEQLFGENYQQYRQWAQATHARLRITAMNQQLSAVDAIPERSIKALALAMSNAEQSTLRALQAEWSLPELTRGGSNVSLDRQLQMARLINENMRAAAAPLLSPKQLGLLDERLRADLESTEAFVQVQRRRRTGGGG